MSGKTNRNYSAKVPAYCAGNFIAPNERTDDRSREQRSSGARWLFVVAVFFRVVRVGGTSRNFGSVATAFVFVCFMMQV